MKPITIFSVLSISAIGAYFILRNLPPEPLPDSVTTIEQTSIEIRVLENDKDPNGDRLRVSRVNDPQYGKATVSADGQLVHYTPQSDFFGNDTFVYHVVDPDGAEVESTVSVNVDFSAPDFHQRHEIATLAEMLNEPPTSVYGSTIDVFLYQDTESNMREITIAGHADSLTCGVTSGAFSGALMYSNARDGDFLLAGSGRMTVPETDPFQILLSQYDASVSKYLSLSRQLSHFRFQIDGDEISVEDAETELGMSLEDAQKELNNLEGMDSVSEYISRVRPLEAALFFQRQAVELAQRSGLLRIHEIPYSIINQVTERIRQAAQSGDNSVIQFSDYLPNENSEAVMYVPMMHLSSAEPVVLHVPVGDFSPEGFTKAAKLYRSELETAVIGSAKRRLNHADRLLKRTMQQEAECKLMTESTLNEIIHDAEWTICDRDSCTKDFPGAAITNREYCEKNIPNLLETRAAWKQEAQEIISQINLTRQEQDTDRIDSLTHAALVDSMLRNWALPFPEAQAAFDHWLKEGRVTAWKSITKAAQKAGVSRAALSGESLVFDVRVENDVLEIRPLMAVDVRRSHLVIEPKLGVTALVNPWELRTVVISSSIADSTARDATALILEDPAAYKTKLLSKPRSTVSSFIDHQIGNLPVDGFDWSKRREEALRGQARLFIDELANELNISQNNKFISQDDAWVRAEELTLPMYLARHAKYMGASFRLNVAHSFLHTALTLEGRSGNDAWELIRNAYLTSKTVVLKTNSSELWLGDSFDTVLKDLFDRSQKEDPEGFRFIINQATPPKLPKRSNKPLTSTWLTKIVNDVEKARSLLATRSAIDHAITAYNEDGSVRVSDLKEAFVQPKDIAPIYIADIWQQMSLLLRYYSKDARQGRLGPIEGQKILSAISYFKEIVESRLRQVKPILTSLRYGHDQEAIVTRLLFDEGAYAEAFERLTPTRSTLKQYHPTLIWEPISADIKGLPDDIAVRAERGIVIISASIGGQSHDVMQINGLAAEDQKILIDNPPEPTVPWNEGDPLWEQMLISEVPARQEVKNLSSKLKDDSIYLSMLKAMVYACAAPATDILEQGGRCASVSGSTQLYDRIQDSEAVSFDVPDDSEMQILSVERFNRPRAWRFERPENASAN